MLISNKILEVLKAISTINQQVILKEEYLFSKVEDNNDEVTKVKMKGTQDIIINYNVPEGELKLDGLEIGISNISHFLSVIKTYDSESLEISNEGLDLKLIDKRKSGTYVSQTVDTLPVKNPKGDELYKAGETVIRFVLTQDEKDAILNDLNAISPERLILESEDDKLYLKAINESTGNSCKITLNEDNVTTAKGTFIFPNPALIGLLIQDDFKVTLKVIETPDGEELQIINFDAILVKGLSYKSIRINEV